MYNLRDKRKCPICGGTVILKSGVIRPNDKDSGRNVETEWECTVCKTKFGADIMVGKDGTMEAQDRYIEKKIMEEIRPMGEAKNKWRM